MRLRFAAASIQLAAAVLLFPATAQAQEHPTGQGSEHPTHTDSHASTDAAHGHKHHLSFLVGLSDNGAIDETAFTIGAGYRYALNDHFAIGPSIDFAFYDHEDTVLLVAALYWKPVGGLLLMAGPGVEFIDYEGSSHGSSNEPHAALKSSESAHEDETKFAFRVGAAYELHIGGVTVAPAVGADFIDGHTTLVYAVAAGFGF